MPDVTIGNVPPVAQASRRVPGRTEAWPQPVFSPGRIRPELEDVAVLQAWVAPCWRRIDRKQPAGRTADVQPDGPPLLDSSTLPPATAQARPMPHRGAGRGRCEGGEPIRFQEEERAYLPLPTESTAPRRHATGGRAGGAWLAAPETALTLPWLPLSVTARPPLRLPGQGLAIGQQLLVAPDPQAVPIPAALVVSGRASPPGGRAIATEAPLDWLLVQLAGPAAPQASVVLSPRVSCRGGRGRQSDVFLRGVELALQVEYVAAWSAPSPAQARTSRPGRSAASLLVTQEMAGPAPVVPFQAWAGPVPRDRVRGSAEGSMPPPAAAGLVVVTGPFELFAYDVYWAGAMVGEIEEV